MSGTYGAKTDISMRNADRQCSLASLTHQLDTHYISTSSTSAQSRDDSANETLDTRVNETHTNSGTPTHVGKYAILVGVGGAVAGALSPLLVSIAGGTYQEMKPLADQVAAGVSFTLVGAGLGATVGALYGAIEPTVLRIVENAKQYARKHLRKQNIKSIEHQ